MKSSTASTTPMPTCTRSRDGNHDGKDTSSSFSLVGSPNTGSRTTLEPTKGPVVVSASVLKPRERDEREIVSTAFSSQETLVEGRGSGRRSP